ncbi:hypothetical protein [Nocardioides sp. LHG3406-4]|uniref:PGAP1-like alpha/beta domain-containing protein n=1 Tax=Nocardioides sp. LHG3406-4 TaxID=2804575 RepID=UPI003CF7C927
MSGEQVPITVSGGAGGVAASYDDLALLGTLYQSVGAALSDAAWDDKLEAADGDLVLSAVLAPQTFAAAEAAILAATYGPHGLVARAVTIEAQSLAFAAVVELYRTADELQRQVYDAMSYGVGVALGVQLVPVALTGALGYLAVRQASPARAADLQQDVVAYLEAHPEVVQTFVNGGGGLLDGLGLHPVSGPFMHALGLDGPHPTTGSAADDLGQLLFGDYSGVAVPTEGDHPYAVPAGIADLIGDLATTEAHGDGAISVQRITGADGDTRWIVHLPGTDDFLDDHAIRNMGANLNLIAGDDTAYGQAVAKALEQAAVNPSDPVMMVGHSQGGMQAAALAADPGFGYHVTHVVTAGAPVATSGIPHDVTVLSLENSADVVPSLDGEDNPAGARHTTVRADVRTGSLGAGDGNHGLAVYADIAGAVDASADPSVAAAVTDMREAVFLGADGVRETSTMHFRTEIGEQLRRPDIADPASFIRNAAA